MKKKKFAIQLLSSCICCLSLCSSYALGMIKPITSTFILKITSDKPQLFLGTYLTNNGLTYIHKQTPFEMQISGKELRLMLGVGPSHPSMTVELLKQDKSGGKFNRLSKATGHSIFMCESNIVRNGKNGCYDVSVLVGN